MIRKTFTLIFLAMAAMLSAQTSVGDWQIYPMFNGNIDYMIDTPEKLYYVSAGTLYSFDHENNESYVYSTRNKLSDSKIQKIFYNDNEGFLLIVYANGNFDMLYDDGYVVNLPELKDNTRLLEKTVNHVAFGKNRIYIAANFGIIIYDSKKHQVVESGIYDKDIRLIAELGDNIAIFAENALRVSPKDARHNSYDKFEEFGDIWASDWIATTDNTLVYLNNNLYVLTVDFANKSINAQKSNLGEIKKMGSYSDGVYAVNSDNKIHLLDSNGQPTAEATIPVDYQGNSSALWSGLESVWFGSEEGVCNVNVPTSTVLSDWYRPNAFSCEYAAYIVKSSDGKSLYFTNIGPSNVFTCADGDGYNIIQTTNRLEGDEITDVSIEKCWWLNGASDFENIQKTNNTERMLAGTTRMIPDPDVEGRYYIANGLAGVFVVEGTIQVALWDRTNSPCYSGWMTRTYDVNIDPEGNLWVGHWNGSGKPSYNILPAAKRKGDPKDVTMADWVASKSPSTYGGTKDMFSVFSKNNPSGKKVAVFGDSNWGGKLMLYNAGTSWSDPSDDTSVVYTSDVYDQDGNKYTPTNYICAVEDQKGRVWLGSTMGVIEITNPAEAINSNTLTVRRPKVPRNDGTNFADFLVETDKVYSIAVDSSNRKWIATEVSGVYLVSEDGDEIIANYNTSNSYLPSNTVYSVMCDPLSNRVFFGTSVGIVSFNGTSSPSKDDYSNVYAYPNPVRPDYTGLITITGLMNNSLVKIADASGSVFFQGRSEGGMVTWDGCAPSGERVRSGVYFVYASQSDDGSSSGVVTKILVIN